MSYLDDVNAQKNEQEISEFKEKLESFLQDTKETEPFEHTGFFKSLNFYVLKYRFFWGVVLFFGFTANILAWVALADTFFEENKVYYLTTHSGFTYQVYPCPNNQPCGTTHIRTITNNENN